MRLIREFVAERFVGEESDVTLEQPLLGIIDSMDLMLLVALIEEEFHIEIDDADIVPGNFRDIASIIRFLSTHCERRGADSP